MGTYPCITNGEIRVLIAVEVRLFREGLAGLLARQPGIVMVDTATDVSSAIEKAQAVRPDIILWDTGFSDSPGTVRALLAAAPSARVVALALTESDPAVISYAEAGMSGYLTVDGSIDELVTTIRSVANGEFRCSPRVAAMLLRKVTRTASAADYCPDVLTRREQQVVDLVSQDLSNKVIASRLNIEVSTVKNHVHHILEKLHLTHRRQIAARVQRTRRHAA